MGVYDVACNRINLKYMCRDLTQFRSFGQYLCQNVFMPLTNGPSLRTNNLFVRLTSSMQIEFNALWCCFYFCNGPLGLFRLTLPDRFDCVCLTTHYIKNAQYEYELYNSLNEISLNFLGNSVNLLKALDWDRESNKCLACLYKILKM